MLNKNRLTKEENFYFQMVKYSKTVSQNNKKTWCSEPNEITQG